MSKEIDLTQLAEPFLLKDIEWRVSRSGISKGNIYCFALAYITARAIQQRLDDVCGPANWRNEAPQLITLKIGVVAMVGGISIKVGDEWITKWDVAEPTNIEPAKGGFSGSMKRAGAQWGLGRYLYYVDETKAEVSETGGSGWIWAKLPEKHGGGTYYWKPPQLPEFACPKENEQQIKEADLKSLKSQWKKKFAPDSQNPAELREGFTRFVHSICGDFPVDDYKCWLRVSFDKCMKQITETTDPKGVSSDVPFDK